ncbi:hypothetical protein WOSG25_070050 [Weissella oryzae SG25]|uniref:Uncharacterized protein n=1 Tax=Weissella oryzae (strain DSM 25784 / JCM 18191 / LMG 30913 / SG25) TaxID=1329250 RepID=A0A069CUW3_WEIOS|nr:hypothetical protein [Weissella oryzae]GAK31028.1 hypothetical protein WOSG25_070050 [Weissella oryzae SG25]
MEHIKAFGAFLINHIVAIILTVSVLITVAFLGKKIATYFETTGLASTAIGNLFSINILLIIIIIILIVIITLLKKSR